MNGNILNLPCFSLTPEGDTVYIEINPKRGQSVSFRMRSGDAVEFARVLTQTAWEIPSGKEGQQK